VAVRPAEVPDRAGATGVRGSLKAPCGGVPKVGADAGPWVAWVAGLRSPRPGEGASLRRWDEAVGLEVLAQRWIVERTRGGRTRCRRLSQDCEAVIHHAGARLRRAMIPVRVRQLAPVTAF
jgi:transposase